MSNIRDLLNKVNKENEESFSFYLKYMQANATVVHMNHKKHTKSYKINDNERLSHQELMTVFINKINDNSAISNKEKFINFTLAFFAKNEVTSKSLELYNKMISLEMKTETETSAIFKKKEDRPAIKEPIKNIHSKKKIPRNLWDKP